jgi:hypothetical protein
MPCTISLAMLDSVAIDIVDWLFPDHISVRMPTIANYLGGLRILRIDRGNTTPACNESADFLRPPPPCDGRSLLVLVINESGSAADHVSVKNHPLSTTVQARFEQRCQSAPEFKEFGLSMFHDPDAPRDVLLVDRFSTGRHSDFPHRQICLLACRLPHSLFVAGSEHASGQPHLPVPAHPCAHGISDSLHVNFPVNDSSVIQGRHPRHWL